MVKHSSTGNILLDLTLVIHNLIISYDAPHLIITVLGQGRIQTFRLGAMRRRKRL